MFPVIVFRVSPVRDGKSCLGLLMDFLEVVHKFIGLWYVAFFGIPHSKVWIITIADIER